MSRIWRGRFLCHLAVLVVLGQGCGGSAGDRPVPDESAVRESAEVLERMGALSPPLTVADIVAGARVFHGEGLCFTCHGARGSGTSLAPDLSDERWIHVDGSFTSIRGLVAQGVEEPREHPGFMLARGGAAITDDQVAQVAAYVWSLSASRRMVQEGLVSAGGS